MRLLLVLAVSSLTVSAFADRLINTPMGRKLPAMQYRVDFLSEISRGRSQEYGLAFGLNEKFDMEIRSQLLDGNKPGRTFDLGYQLVPPFPNLAPGVAVGVQDGLNATPDGRRLYLAMTYRPTLTTLNGDINADVTLGGFFGKFSSAFVGVSLPFSKEFRFLIEHNGVRLASGFEIRPIPGLSMRVVHRESDVMAGLGWSGTF